MGAGASHASVDAILEKLQYDGTITDYNICVSNLTSKDKKDLGKYYNYWRTGCEYKFLVDGKLDPKNDVSDIISEYNQIEAEIYNGEEEEVIKQILTILLATKFEKYDTVLETLVHKLPSGSPLKKSIDSIKI